MDEYIEKQALMERFAEVVAPSNNSDFQKTPTWNNAIEVVENFYPADVRPVVRGKWIVNQTAMGTNYSVCSECEKEFCLWTDYGALIKIDLSGTNYCPNCGADMREEEVKNNGSD